LDHRYTSFHLTAAGCTDPGQRRTVNQDAWRIAGEAETAHLWAERGRFFAVADGMGGHAAGEIASQLAIDTMFDEYYGSNNAPLSPGIRMEKAILAANLKIYEQAALQETQAGMGTTIVAAVVRDNWLTIANVGDSRAYLVRDGEPLQITRDHSWVAEQVEVGALSEEEAQNHMYRSVVTRCLGHRSEVSVDIFDYALESGDVVLLCSDGLSNQVSAEEIAQILIEYPPDQATGELVDLANQYGGPDNITVIVLHLLEPPGDVDQAKDPG
jgi:serine/threonine protein phosphatase PrpC